jgi:hypothetical protein
VTIPITWAAPAVLDRIVEVVQAGYTAQAARYSAGAAGVTLPALREVRAVEWIPLDFDAPGLYLSCIESRISTEGLDGLDRLHVEYDVRGTLILTDGAAETSDPEQFGRVMGGMMWVIAHLVQGRLTAALGEACAACGVYDCYPGRISWYDPYRQQVDGMDVWVQGGEIRWTLRGIQRQRLEV